jgi:hypothetical protein
MGDTFDPGWVAKDSYRLLATPFVVWSTDSMLAERLRWHLSPFRRPAPEPDAVRAWLYPTAEDRGMDPLPISYFRDDELRLRSDSLARLLEYVVWDVHACVPQKTRDFLLLHAGGVVRGGGALLIVAEADVGKSSLVARLLEIGFDYLSDELGVIDPGDRRAHPFPKRISLNPEGSPLRPSDRGANEPADALAELALRFVAPEDLGASIADPSPIRWLLFPSLDRQGPPRLTALPRAEAVRRMAALSFNLYRYGERGVVVLSEVADRAEAFGLDGGSVDERADLIAERFVSLT